MKDELIHRTETADEYGRRARCLKNYTGAPFCFQAYIPYLQGTVQPTDRDRLVAQPGLRVIVLPPSNTIHDTIGCDQNQEANLTMFLQDSPFKTPPLVAGLSPIKDLRIPVESLDLGSRPEIDVQEYLKEISTKQYCNAFDQWLPLESVHADSDEGLPFPPRTGRLQSLLQRELDREQVTSSDEASILEKEAYGSPLTTEDEQFLAKYTRPEPSQYNYPEPITPPLSPVSDESPPFIPNNDTTIIDLVSEPSSPVNKEVRLLQSNAQDGCIDSEPVVPSTLPTSSSSQELPEYMGNIRSTLQDVRADVPIVLTSSDTPCEEDVLANACLPSVADDESFPGPQHREETYFEDAFMALLDDHCTRAGHLSEQERLNPFDSISRIPVPVLDFEIPQPDWKTQCSNAKSHFIWLKGFLPTTFNIPLMARDPRSDSALKWTPVPQRNGRVVVSEELRLLNESTRNYLAVDQMPDLSSASFVSVKSSMTVLKVLEDEEIELLAPMTDDNANGTSSPTEREQHSTTLNRTGSIQEAKSSYFQNQDWSSLLRPLCRKTIDDSTSILPKPSDTSATSKLLSGFMELRAAKKPRLNISSIPTSQATISGNSSPHLQNTISTAAKEQRPFHGEGREMVPAVAPDIDIPLEKGSFIISLSLGRSILQHLETVWPSENLIDMGYSQHNTMTWSAGTVQPKETISPLIFEADISLSPSVGVMCTNLLKVKQRPLPGTKAKTPLRERLQKVSRKYETLVVLVSESNPTGEFTGTLAPSDLAAYADFVRFAVALEAEVNVYFVPGAEATLGKWIMSLMGRYSHQSVALRRFLSVEETSWEVFLRRAGMNVVAAKVLSKTLLEEAGASGLARFLVISAQERISRYGELLGGEKVLRKAGEVLDRKWG